MGLLTKAIPLICVGLGGFLGSVLRYSLGLMITHFGPNERFPFHTFLINILGCGAAGALAGIWEKNGFVHPYTRLFLLTGLLGGFTTFSAFGLETWILIRQEQTLLAIFNVIGSITLGILTLALCMKTVS